MVIVEATFVSEFQDGTIVRSSCIYNLDSGRAYDIEIVDVEIDASVEREYVELASGAMIEVEVDERGEYYRVDD